MRLSSGARSFSEPTCFGVEIAVLACLGQKEPDMLPGPVRTQVTSFVRYTSFVKALFDTLLTEPRGTTLRQLIAGRSSRFG